MIEKLKQFQSLGTIAVMPDFFVDRIIRIDSVKDMLAAIEDKARNGGGSIRDVPTTDTRGGNAVNTAYALAKLGAKVSLFTIADSIGAAMIRQVFSQFGESVTLRILPGRHGYTTSFEFPHNNTRVNVMASDVGDNDQFGANRIASQEDLSILKNADAVMVLNWASNKQGTELIDHVFTNSPSAMHFIDPADISHRREEFRDALFKLSTIIDCLSINENECSHLGQALGLELPLGSTYGPDDVKLAARKIAESVGITTDLHTRIGSAWSNGRDVEFVHAIKIDPKILTGAGDVWDAADIIGYLAGLEPRERLLFSNAAASLFVREASGEPPTMNKVFELIERVR